MSGNLLIYALPVLLIGFMIMQQRKRQRAVQSLQSSLSVGDEVTTTSGLIGRISAMDDIIVTLEVAPGVRIRFDRRAIAGPAPTAGPISATGTSGASATGTSGASATGTSGASGTGTHDELTGPSDSTRPVE